MRIVDLKAALTLNDLFAALPGAFILAGYLIALYFASQHVTSEVQVRQQNAAYETKQIRVWRPHPEDEEAKEFDYYEVKSARLNEQGKPILSFEAQTFVGKGNPIVSDSRTRILIAQIGDPPLRKATRLVTTNQQVGPYGPVPGSEFSYNEVFYEPVITYIETDFEEVKKSVVFDVGINSQKYAVYGGIIGSGLSVLYFVARALIALWANRKEITDRT